MSVCHSSMCGGNVCDKAPKKFINHDKSIQLEKTLLHRRQYFTSVNNVAFYRYTHVYEIVVINKSCDKITNVQIKDSLFGGLAFLTDVLNGGAVNNAGATVTNFVGTLTPVQPVVFFNDGLLLVPSSSYLEPGAISRLVLTVFFDLPEQTTLSISELCNTLVLSGEVTKNNVTTPIIPIYAKSA